MNSLFPPTPQDQTRQIQDVMNKIKESGVENCFSFIEKFLFCVQKKGSIEGCEKAFKKQKNCLQEGAYHFAPQFVKDDKDKEEVNNMKKLIASFVLQNNNEAMYSKENVDKDLGNLNLKCWSSLKKLNMCNEYGWFIHKRQGYMCRQAHRELMECAAKSYNLDVSEYTKCWKKELSYDTMTPVQVVQASKKCFPLADHVVKRFSEKKENLSNM